MKVLSIVGARPNFMKVAPVVEALRAAGIEAPLVHTGQHYDERMSQVFFEDLGMPRPDENLNVGSGSHAVQTARIMEAFEPVLLRHRPDYVLVAGDVNSTIACALVSVKLGVPVAHLEAGLRSWDRWMPEEINRVLTDQISDVLLTPSADADENLLREGIAKAKIHRVGNAMIDSLRKHLDRAKESAVLRRLELKPGAYGVVTLHRPSNVDEPAALEGLVTALAEISEELPLIFPVHPRTRHRMEQVNSTSAPGLRLVEPMGYLDFLALQAHAKLMLTDSGGIQEETTALGVPCLTVRDSTERPVTIAEGTNTLVGTDPRKLIREAKIVLATGGRRGRIPDLWDGQTGRRVARTLMSMKS